MTWKTTDITNAMINGTINASNAVMTLFERLDEAVMSSLLDRRRTSRTATKAPPIPRVIPVVMVTALVVAAAVEVIPARSGNSCP
jgi:hypothetical protein